MIHPGAVVIPPVFIGENSKIHKKASIGPYAVVGSNAVVDESAIVSDSIIMEKTYVGSQTEIRNAAVRKNMLFHFQMATQAWVADDFILGDLESRKITGKIEDWCHRFLGVLLFAISLPVFGPLMIYSLIFRSSNYFIAQHCLGNSLETDMKGCSRCRPFKMYRFKSRWLALQKIPGLLNVIQGNLRLVGCLPPKKQDKEAQICKYNPQNRPAGLVHLWEVEGESGLTEEEVYVADNYFAATRTFKKDMIILAKFLLGFRARPK